MDTTFNKINHDRLWCFLASLCDIFTFLYKYFRIIHRAFIFIYFFFPVNKKLELTQGNHHFDGLY